MKSVETTDLILPPNWVYYNPEPGSEENDLLRRVGEILEAEDDPHLPEFAPFDRPHDGICDICDINASHGNGTSGGRASGDADRDSLRLEIDGLVGERDSLRDELAAIETAIGDAETELAEVSGAVAVAENERPVLYAVNPIPLYGAANGAGLPPVEVQPIYEYTIVHSSGRFLDVFM